MQEINNENLDLRHYTKDDIMNSNMGKKLTSKNYYKLMRQAKYGAQLMIGDILGQGFTSEQSKNLFLSLRLQEQTLDNINRLRISNLDREILVAHVNHLKKHGIVGSLETGLNANNLANGGEQPNRARFCFDCCGIF